MEDILNKLKEFGFSGTSKDDALLFCDIQINEYWVDCPPRHRTPEAKDYAKKCNMFKKIKKEIKSL